MEEFNEPPTSLPYTRYYCSDYIIGPIFPTFPNPFGFDALGFLGDSWKAIHEDTVGLVNLIGNLIGNIIEHYTNSGLETAVTSLSDLLDELEAAGKRIYGTSYNLFATS